MNYPDYAHRISTTIGKLAAAYGVTAGEADENPEEKICLYRSEDGWHVTEDLSDELWAPHDDAQADEILPQL